MLSLRDIHLVMLERRRRLSVAAFILSILAAAAAPAAAQETNSAAPAPTTVGPPQLKDFRLPGQRTTPPAQTQPQQPIAQPPAAQPQRTPPVADRPAPRTQPAAPASRPAQQTPSQQPSAQPAPGAAPPAATPAPQAAPPVATQRAPGFESALPAGRPAAPAPAAARGSAFSSNWLWIGGGLLLLLLGLYGFRRFSAIRAAAARQAQRESRAAERAAAAEAAAAEAAAMAAMPRARLEIGFVPERAVATDAETIVHYDLVLRNVGEDSARNIRIDTRMFNASARGAISAFLKGPIHDQSGSPLVRIAPGAELKLASQIAMPKEQVRGIEVQGRSIFVPVVAINVAYDWGVDGNPGTGRTSLSWLVGREPETPSDKMGPFRLDVGPRVYRSVGQRPTELANVA